MILQLVPQDICLRCRGCCRFAEIDSVWSPALLEEEIDKLAAEQIPPAVISRAKKMRVEPDASCGNSYKCVMLNPSDNRCIIYNDRPLDCQLYPFLLIERDGKRRLAYDPHCPFAKEHHREHAFTAYAEKLCAFLARAETRAALKRNPHIFQPYPEAVVCAELTA